MHVALELAEGVFGQMGGTEALVGAQQSPQCLASFQHAARIRRRRCLTVANAPAELQLGAGQDALIGPEFWFNWVEPDSVLLSRLS